MDISQKTILITGGTGSLGRALTKYLVNNVDFNRIIIFSRDELKQFEMSNEINNPKVSYFIGDVRDRQRVFLAMKAEVDIVIHAAALKQVPACEINPFEAIKTNIIGAQNVIDASIENKVQRVIAISTDKAAAPINLYGATKLAADKLFIAAHNYVGKGGTRFSVVRYGNVMASRGSVIPFFASKRDHQRLPITDTRMTRFNITIDEAVQFVLNSLRIAQGREIFVPRIPSYRILDLATAVSPDAEHEIIGIRPGEKIHEELVTSTDSISTLKFENFHAIYPSRTLAKERQTEYKLQGMYPELLDYGYSYNSGENEVFLSVDDLKGLISQVAVST